MGAFFLACFLGVVCGLCGLSDLMVRELLREWTEFLLDDWLLCFLACLDDLCCTTRGLPGFRSLLSGIMYIILYSMILRYIILYDTTLYVL